MKSIFSVFMLASLVACGGGDQGSNGDTSHPNINDTNKAVASPGALAQANVECVERKGQLVGKRGGGVICKLPNGQIVDQMTFL